MVSLSCISSWNPCISLKWLEAIKEMQAFQWSSLIATCHQFPRSYRQIWEKISYFCAFHLHFKRFSRISIKFNFKLRFRLITKYGSFVLEQKPKLTQKNSLLGFCPNGGLNLHYTDHSTGYIISGDQSKVVLKQVQESVAQDWCVIITVQRLRNIIRRRNSYRLFLSIVPLFASIVCICQFSFSFSLVLVQLQFSISLV